MTRTPKTAAAAEAANPRAVVTLALPKASAAALHAATKELLETRAVASKTLTTAQAAAALKWFDGSSKGKPKDPVEVKLTQNGLDRARLILQKIAKGEREVDSSQVHKSALVLLQGRLQAAIAA